jgi:hypothetical protein
MHVFGIISFMLLLFIITYCDLEISQDKTNTTSRLLLHQELQQHLFRCVLWNQNYCSHCGSFLLPLQLCILNPFMHQPAVHVLECK